MNDQVRPLAVDQAAVRRLADQVLGQVPALLDAAGKYLTEVQQQKLDSHVLAMARRSLSGEGLPDFDKSLFDEISDTTRRLSAAVVALFGNLPEEEALLLSIHFEMAKNKA
ncbi:PRD domain protein (TIGR03582 family) [Chromobacterium alkanivorans]|uniref:hypothetical protein n=1 Tax=Chromobacterium alkanivorans TaxID=1071719 RepID=UPI001968498A|nr:hypothetical protein [Chromobacterium alkanivorans]MBN3005980.1 hypothetical protein [Chromobacterium alkanivorans]MCS3802477.1 PRD domain protein (TIGR03582 family) [Chromobacterium alkanivorans]MCS3816803.1 PRD domain protein (TIGR03582 family) [Chromobacterium alkanivorans]MCS3871843.1 PRD domain protein (TIGR03582 family) [Chromobacterium alkanivorans]